MAIAKMDGLLLTVAVLLCLSGNGLAFMAPPAAGFCTRRSIVSSHEMHRFAVRFPTRPLHVGKTLLTRTKATKPSCLFSLAQTRINSANLGDTTHILPSFAASAR